MTREMNARSRVAPFAAVEVRAPKIFCECEPVHTALQHCGAFSHALIPRADLVQAAAQPRRTVMQHSMKLLAVVVVASVIAAPAFAQVQNGRDDGARAGWSSRVHVYAPEFYARPNGNDNTNPDYQLGGGR
jgi:hypothetical protein